MNQKATKKTLRLLLSGKASIYNKYVGKHVFVIKDKVIPFKKGKDSIKDFKSLEKKYGHKPILMFVPKKGVSYILLLCLS
ncbi:MAG: hypothetical protein HYY52_08080 [Candidatus Melainabacteria bacterium]|nr:hypothetical protein [Candidatus Melainabacteria bacterium]